MKQGFIFLSFHAVYNGVNQTVECSASVRDMQHALKIIDNFKQQVKGKEESDGKKCTSKG